MPADKPPYSATTPSAGNKPQWEDPAARVAREIEALAAKIVTEVSKRTGGVLRG